MLQYQQTATNIKHCRKVIVISMMYVYNAFFTLATQMQLDQL